jgi:hypothetical protein
MLNKRINFGATLNLCPKYCENWALVVIYAQKNELFGQRSLATEIDWNTFRCNPFVNKMGYKKFNLIYSSSITRDCALGYNIYLAQLKPSVDD